MHKAVSQPLPAKSTITCLLCGHGCGGKTHSKVRTKGTRETDLSDPGVGLSLAEANILFRNVQKLEVELYD